MNLNKVFIIGRLTADPQLRSTPSGAQVASFGVATNRVWTDASGAKKESAEFHNIVVWGKQAEVAGRFLVKGSSVFVEGRLQTREWEGKDGQKRRITEIICERMQLGPRPGGAFSGGAATKADLPTVEIGDEVGSPDAKTEDEIKSEDLPF